MRGLTPEERAALDSSSIEWRTDELVDRLQKRGLIVTATCQAATNECPYLCNGRHYWLSPLGELAYRLDSAARSVEP